MGFSDADDKTKKGVNVEERIERAEAILEFVDMYCNLDGISDYDGLIDGIATILDNIYNKGYSEGTRGK